MFMQIINHLYRSFNIAFLLRIITDSEEIKLNLWYAKYILLLLLLLLLFYLNSSKVYHLINISMPLLFITHKIGWEYNIIL
jgi:hypothetical protein